jgi:exo-beta-1,3-glucanase (GH17 family)
MFSIKSISNFPAHLIIFAFLSLLLSCGGIGGGSSSTKNQPSNKPINLKAIINFNDMVSLSWNKSSENVENFIIKESRNNGEFNELDQIEANTTTYDVSAKLNELEKTCYTVIAHNNAGDSEPSEPACVTLLNRIHGLNFGPYERGQDPNLGAVVPKEQMTRKIEGVAPYCRWVKTFGSGGGLEVAGQLAHANGLKIAMGAWLGPDSISNREQIDSLIAACRRNEVDLAMVGSEVLLREDLSESELLTYIEEFKTAVPDIPVTYSEAYDVLLDHPAVITACDVIMVNIHPFWEGIDIEQAVQSVSCNYNLIQAESDGKEIIISETGWPSDGDSIGEAEPTLTNSIFFLMNVVSWAEANNINIFFSEAYDEPWKAQYEGTHGDDWGIMFEDGVLKSGMRDIFMGERIEGDWNCPDSPGEPEILFTYVPPYGSDDNLRGQVLHVSPDEHFVTVFINVNDRWWVKPYWNEIRTPIQRDGSFVTDITTGGMDPQAREIIAFIFENDYDFPDSPPSGSYLALPQELFDNALAYVRRDREQN